MKRLLPGSQKGEGTPVGATFESTNVKIDGTRQVGSRLSMLVSKTTFSTNKEDLLGPDTQQPFAQASTDGIDDPV